MPYFHIHVVVMGQNYYEYDQTLESVQKFFKLFNANQKLLVNGVLINPKEIGKLRICETELRNEEIIGARVWDVGINVTRRFITSPPSDDFAPKPPNKDIFMVHGQDHKSVKELKKLLQEIGLNPIVLHEQASGSRTIIEKLEKYSKVGYAFVILTPDDISGKMDDFLSALDGMVRGYTDLEDAFELGDIHYRARQNVILEFGYFIGKLGRDKVCCLLKGDVERPSDMHGIVYIPFKDSVEEVHDKIITELKAVGY